MHYLITALHIDGMLLKVIFRLEANSTHEAEVLARDVGLIVISAEIYRDGFDSMIDWDDSTTHPFYSENKSLTVDAVGQDMTYDSSSKFILRFTNGARC